MKKCRWCGGPLQGRQRTYCSATCSRRWRNSLCNPWHRWKVYGGVKAGKVDRLP